MDISAADTVSSQIINPARESQQVQREQERSARAQELPAARSESLSSSPIERAAVAPVEPQVPARESGNQSRFPSSPDRVSLSAEALRAAQESQSGAGEGGTVIDNDTGELVPQRPEPEPQNRSAINAYASVQQLTGL
ncbi:MAG: hypothetical protein AseanaTS_22330 [Candidatus Pelagadaptatus aseana]|uniref:hypothetical protein n=1 Tax=Candidatus Pelagadaptatus aseana TaxID=3120508 RepID=UPI0039B26188